MKNRYKKCKVCSSSVYRVNEKYNLVKCTSCELVFCDFQYGLEDFKACYDKLYNYENPQYKKHSITEFNQINSGVVRLGYNRKTIINRYVKKSSKVLEIGSGIGLVGYYLTNIAKISRYTGIEIDEQSHLKAIQLGVNSQNGDFRMMSAIDGAFDIVMMWEVLEHIQEIEELFTLVNDKLNKGGLFIASVPNYNKRKNFKTPEDELFQSGPPIHLNFFTKESLSNTLTRNGFEILRLKEKKFPYFNKSLNYITSSLKSLVGNYHGSTLYVVARKL
ncbi:class I SAM-dependent methyltransferase [Nonlabens tegetincola]|uniref:class I SAM-dependent methyltransferase n=1 Tax=Nonlabens tegetincola TaxID=323273 RepID=UPI000A010B8F|nr:class I SAM-dependent methyltransferase [Nonlabens tegetincola]